MLTEEFSTLSQLILEQAVKNEDEQQVAVVGIARPTAYAGCSEHFCCYQVEYGQGTIRMIESAAFAPMALQAALHNLSAIVYCLSDKSARFDRWQGFPCIPDVAAAADLIDANDWAGAIPYLSRSAERGIAWARSSLGTAYLMGFGMPVDEELGIHWTTLAAEQGDPGASDLLAMMYRFPESKRYAPEKAEYYGERAKLCGSEVFVAPVNRVGEPKK